MPVLPLLLLAGFGELAALIAVGAALGPAPTVLLVLATSVLGALLLRHQGRRALSEMRTATLGRGAAEAGLADGAVRAGAGLLLTLPGFLSDLAGLACLLPPVRAHLRRRLDRWARRHTVMPGPGPGGAPRSSPRGGDVIDGEVVSTDDDPPTPPSRPRLHPTD